MAELKPCPFCGGEAMYFAKCRTERGVIRGWQFGIYCTKCNVTTPKTDYKIEISFDPDGEIREIVSEREEAAKAWNRRADNEQRETD